MSGQAYENTYLRQRGPAAANPAVLPEINSYRPQPDW